MKWVGLALLLAVLVVAMGTLNVILPTGKHAKWPTPQECRRAMYIFALVPTSVGIFLGFQGFWSESIAGVGAGGLLVFQAKIMAVNEEADRHG